MYDRASGKLTGLRYGSSKCEHGDRIRVPEPATSNGGDGGRARLPGGSTFACIGGYSDQQHAGNPGSGRTTPLWPQTRLRFKRLARRISFRS